MRHLFVRLLITLILYVVYSVAIAGYKSDEPLPFDLEQWMEYQDRKDFSISVDVLKPYLTLQQRTIVPVRATIDANGFGESREGPKFHLVLKVAPEGKDWDPGCAYMTVTLPRYRGKYAGFYYVASGVYLSPGRYKILLIMYDSVSGRGNVHRKEVEVSPIKGKVIENLDHDLPDIEFATDPPQILSFGHVNGALASGWEWLPVNNSRSLCIEIVANAATDNNNKNVEDFGNHYAYPLHIMQVASVLSHLTLQNGRIRVTILDALQSKTYFDREDANLFDWQQASQGLLYPADPDTVEYGMMEAQSEASIYLIGRLHEIIRDDACAPAEAQPLKIVIVVSGPLKFPVRTRVQQLNPQKLMQNTSSTRFYFFRIVHTSYSTYYDNSMDDLRKMMEPVKPQTIEVKDPGSFREALISLISQLEGF